MTDRWAVLLDAGGVILDETEHERRQAELITEAISEIVPGYTSSDYARDVQAAVACYVPRVYLAVIYERAGRDAALTERIWRRHLERWRANRPPLRLMPGIDDVIRDLNQDHDLALAGQYGEEVTAFLEEQGLLDHFTCGLHQGHYDVTKPDPRFFEQIAAILGTDHERCIVVGDRIDKDVVPAHMCGMKAVLVRVGLHVNQQPRLPDEIAEVELPDVTGLPDAVRSLSETSSGP